MKVTYTNPGFRHSIESILQFETDGTRPYWSDTLFDFYPMLSRDAVAGRNKEEQVRYLTDTLAEVYREISPELDIKVNQYNEHFMKYESQINDALSDAFDLDTSRVFNDLNGYTDEMEIIIKLITNLL